MLDANFEANINNMTSFFTYLFDIYPNRYTYGSNNHLEFTSVNALKSSSINFCTSENPKEIKLVKDLTQE